jgi:hypothetical protein
VTQDSAQLLRAIKGPVMMITVGVLFALDNFTPFSFGRTWPVLLMVAGILSLGKTPPRVRYQYQTQWGPPQPPPPPATPAAPSGYVDPTTGPGTYRGSNYESAPGATSTPRASENREKQSPPGTGGGTTL